MKNSVIKIIYIFTALLFTASCQLSEDLMDAMNEYNTDALLTVTVSPGVSAQYNNDAMLVTCTPSETGFTVKYTIDGSDPSRTAGTEYTSPFAIDTAGGFIPGTIEIRVVAYDENRISNVVSRTVVLGDGTAATTPYEIATATQLANAAANVNSGTDAAAYFRQVADIDLSSYATASAGTGWTPIGDGTPFTGNYNGGSYTIRNLTINRAVNNQGLFGTVSGNAALQNITLTDVNLTGGGSTGALAGDVNGTAITVDNCDVTGTSQISGVTSTGGLIGYSYNAALTNCSVTAIVTGTADNIGGLIGYFESNSAGISIDNCTSSGQVTGMSYTGGLIGNNGSVNFGAAITNSSSSSIVSGTDFVGGLVGMHYHSASITNCFSSGSVTATDASSYAGGLVGDLGIASSVTGSYSTGSVTGIDYTGGLIGRNNSAGTIGNNNYATGDVTGGSYTGGFVGYNVSTTGTGNYATGDVSGANFVGGFAGDINSISVTTCYSLGIVTATGSSVGGFAGRATSSNITDCYSKGNIVLNGALTVNCAGGFIGQMASSGYTILRCFSRGNITNNNANYASIGGFAGKSAGNITNCYSTGAVQSSGMYNGGFYGTKTDGSTTNCYSTGNVSGTGSFFGGFTGDDPGVIAYVSCYWLQDGTINSGLNDEGNAIINLLNVNAELQSSMYIPGTYIGWGFGTDWNITAGSTYPYLIYETSDFPF